MTKFTLILSMVSMASSNFLAWNRSKKVMRSSRRKSDAALSRDAE